MRREFSLPSIDQEHLNATGLPWELITHAGEYWLLLHELSLPIGYRVTAASVAIKIEPGYPNAQLDMAYFHPALTRADGKPIPCTDVIHDIDGKKWQRWSRHRTQQNPWIPGEDSLETHLVLVNDWLVREFQKR